LNPATSSILMIIRGYIRRGCPKGHSPQPSQQDKWASVAWKIDTVVVAWGSEMAMFSVRCRLASSSILLIIHEDHIGSCWRDGWIGFKIRVHEYPHAQILWLVPVGLDGHPWYFLLLLLLWKQCLQVGRRVRRTWSASPLMPI
jgi:hypothetical protein